MPNQPEKFRTESPAGRSAGVHPVREKSPRSAQNSAFTRCHCGPCRRYVVRYSHTVRKWRPPEVFHSRTHTHTHSQTRAELAHTHTHTTHSLTSQVRNTKSGHFFTDSQSCGPPSGTPPTVYQPGVRGAFFHIAIGPSRPPYVSAERLKPTRQHASGEQMGSWRPPRPPDHRPIHVGRVRPTVGHIPSATGAWSDDENAAKIDVFCGWTSALTALGLCLHRIEAAKWWPCGGCSTRFMCATDPPGCRPSNGRRLGGIARGPFFVIFIQIRRVPSADRAGENVNKAVRGVWAPRNGRKMRFPWAIT